MSLYSESSMAQASLGPGKCIRKQKIVIIQGMLLYLGLLSVLIRIASVRQFLMSIDSIRFHDKIKKNP